VSRILRVRWEKIQKFGSGEHVECGGNWLRLVRLDPRLESVKGLPEGLEFYDVILAKTVSPSVGLLVSSVEDVVKTEVALAEKSIDREGVCGTVGVGNERLPFLDALCERDLTNAEKEEEEILRFKCLLGVEKSALYQRILSRYLGKFRRVKMVTNGIMALEELGLHRCDGVLVSLEAWSLEETHFVQNIRRLNGGRVALAPSAEPRYRQDSDRQGSSFQSLMRKPSGKR
jgi:hypothetical protein